MPGKGRHRVELIPTRGYTAWYPGSNNIAVCMVASGHGWHQPARMTERA